jgi:uncharacterized protein (TIGR02647 family)
LACVRAGAVTDQSTLTAFYSFALTAISVFHAILLKRNNNDKRDSAMKLSTELVQELEVLSLFPRESTQMGLKFHHDAASEHIAAAKRLFEKQLISLEDGGYLTDLGIEAADHAQGLLTILRSHSV